VIVNHIVKTVEPPSHSLHAARRSIWTIVLKFLHVMVVFSYVLMKKILIHVQVCDCAAYSGLFEITPLTTVKAP
jgi:hypothetical protein